MGRDPLGDVRRWLAAEGQDDREAEAAFRAVFRVLPRLGPPPAFAARVSAALLATAANPARHRPVWQWLRPLIAVGLVLTGLAVFGVAAAGPVPNFVVLLSAWTSAVAGAAVWLSRILDGGLAVWNLCSRIGEAAQLVAATPTATIVLAGNAGVALAAFCGLRRLLSPREETVTWQ